MIGAVADEGEIAAVGILAAKAVTAAGAAPPAGRGRAAARRRHRLVQRIDRVPVGDIEHDTHHRRLRAAMQAEDVMIAAGAAKIGRVVARLDRRQTPHRLIEARRFLEIGGDQLDAAHAANETLRHIRLISVIRCASSLPRSRAAPKSFASRAAKIKLASAASRAATAVAKARCSRARIGRDAGELRKRRDRLMHAHAAAVERARAFCGGGFEEFGLQPACR